MTRAEALKLAQKRLIEAGVETPPLDAKLLLLNAESIDGAALMANPDAEMMALEAFDSAITRRCAREPVSKILGYRDFWSHRFAVNSDVLDPRPDTETLIETVLEFREQHTGSRIADLGTGSGCILLTLLSELPNANGIGVDISEPSIKTANFNAKVMKLDHRVNFITSDWFTALDGGFNLVVSNPPYIPLLESDSLSPEVRNWDPEIALFAGMDGLQAYREIADGLAAVLTPDGMAVLELGHGQADSVAALFKNAGFNRISSRRDLGGIERCIVVQR